MKERGNGDESKKNINRGFLVVGKFNKYRENDDGREDRSSTNGESG